jgi:hypothetical protein
MTTTIIETDVTHLAPAPGVDPLSQALRERGYHSISIGLRTAQVDGALYDLDPLGQALVSGWLRGAQPALSGTVRLVRRTITAGRA